MQKIFLMLILLPFMSLAQAEEQRVEHFSGLAAETLPEAVRNFVDYSEKLAQIITQNELSNEDMTGIHELTYTLENALEKIHAELGALKETLESLHLASEEFNADAVSEYAQAFLQVVEQLNADVD